MSITIKQVAEELVKSTFVDSIVIRSPNGKDHSIDKDFMTVRKIVNAANKQIEGYKIILYSHEPCPNVGFLWFTQSGILRQWSTNQHVEDLLAKIKS